MSLLARLFIASTGRQDFAEMGLSRIAGRAAEPGQANETQHPIYGFASRVSDEVSPSEEPSLGGLQ